MSLARVTSATKTLQRFEIILHVLYTETGESTITLPTEEMVSGRYVIIKDAYGNATTNNIIIETEGAETIDGASNLSITADYGSVFVYATNTSWYIS